MESSELGYLENLQDEGIVTEVDDDEPDEETDETGYRKDADNLWNER